MSRATLLAMSDMASDKGRFPGILSLALSMASLRLSSCAEILSSVAFRDVSSALSRTESCAVCWSTSEWMRRISSFKDFSC
jgi:hypothetical protein